MELYHAMTCFIVYWQEFVRLNSSLPFVKVNSTPDWNLLLQMTGREKRVFSILNSTVLWGIILPLNSENGGISLMVTITKNTIIGDILDVAPQTAPIFLSIGMHCLGCPSSRGETVEEACMVHGVDVDKLLALVNEEANKAQ